MRVLIVGLGSIANKHIHALKILVSDVTIYAFRSNGNAHQVDGVINIFDLNEVKEKFDFAIISNPTAAHCATILQLLPLRIPLFIEKPLFHTLENASSVIAKCQSTQIATYVACNLRFNPCVRKLKDYLSKSTGTINEVNIYCGSYLPEWRPIKDFRENYSAISELGGGVHLDLIHEIDYTCWLLGAPIRHMKTLGSNSSLRIDAVDYAHYQFEYSHYYANITLNYFRRDARRYMEVITDEGTIEMDLLKNTITLGGHLIFSQPENIYYTYIQQMAYFLDALKQRTPLMNDINEAYSILKVCLQ